MKVALLVRPAPSGRGASLPPPGDMLDPNGRSRPEIEYPCHWRYRVIGKDGLTLRAVIATILGDREYTVEDGNTSRGGKYRSVDVAVVVDDEDTRLSIFYQLSWHVDVVFVI